MADIAACKNGNDVQKQANSTVKTQNSVKTSTTHKTHNSSVSEIVNKYDGEFLRANSEQL